MMSDQGFQPLPSEKTVQNQQDSEDDFIDVTKIIGNIKNAWRYVWKRWYWLLLAGMIGGALGFYYAYTRPVTYTATVSFVQEEGKGGGGLGSLASSFGIDIGSLTGGGSMMSGDNILGVFNSPRILKNVMLSPWDETGKISLADKYAEVYKLSKGWEKKFGQQFQFIPGQEKLPTVRHDSLVGVMMGIIFKTQLLVDRRNKKMSFIDLKMTSENEQLSALIANRMVKEATDFYIETKTQRIRQNVDRLQHRADSIGALLNRQSYVAAAAQSQALDVNPAFQTATVGAEINNRNKVMLGTIFAEVTKQLEIQKATLTQETPVMQVLDSADLPLQRNKTSKLKFLIIGGMVAGILLIGFWWYKENVRPLFASNDNRKKSGF